MSPARLAGRVAVTVVALLAVAVLVVGLVAAGVVQRTLPKTDGTLTLRGLTGPVEIVRDARGVPNVYADTPEDLFLAQGFVAAQDRFFEMDLRRHVTAGRLAELVGPDGVATDRLVRTLGWRRVAAAELPLLHAYTRRYLQAYADGVNAYLRSEGESPSSIALEYTALAVRAPGYRIEPWDAVDSLAWLKALAWDLHGNYDAELDRAAMLADGRTLAQVRALYPADDRFAPILDAADWTPPPVVSPVPAPRAVVTGAAADPVGGLRTDGTPVPGPAGATTPAAPAPAASTASAPGHPAGRSTARAADPAAPETSAGSVAAVDRTRAALADLRHLVGQGDGIGSNSWVVAGEHTTTGRPLLANDPHLAASVPGIWHQVGLHCRRVGPACPYDVTGFDMAAMPGIVIGHTPTIAWGFTNLDPDVSDFYLERVRGSRVERGTGTEPLTTRTETISVAGGTDQRVTVRSTRHGPIVSDVSDDVAAGASEAAVGGDRGTRDAVALAWTGLVPGRAADALFAIDRARTGADVRAALELFGAPGQNCVWADTSGHIGYQAPGLVPVRRSAVPGTPPGWLPAPGWDPAYDWTGYVPFAAMPHVTDPASGRIVTANQRATAATTPYLTTDWTVGWRSQRITDLLAARLRDGGKISPGDMRAVATDTTSLFAVDLSRALLAVHVDAPFVRQGQDTLRGWSGAHPVGRSADSRAAAYFEAVWRETLPLVLTHPIGEHVRPDGGGTWAWLVTTMLDHPRDPLWDDPTTPAIETRDAVLLTAMTRARERLTSTLGKDPSSWDWGRLHEVTLRHPLSDGLPGLLRRSFDRGAYPAPGSALSVNAMGFDASTGTFAVDWAPSMRVVVDLADLDRSTWVTQTGVSGHPFDDHYDDQVQDWLAGRSLPWASTRAAVDAAATTRQTLTPDPSGN